MSYSLTIFELYHSVPIYISKNVGQLGLGSSQPESSRPWSSRPGQISAWSHVKVRNRTKVRNRYNQAPHLTQDTNGKVTTSQLNITSESQEVSPLSAVDHKVSKGAKIRNRYNQVPHPTQDTNGKVTRHQ